MDPKLVACAALFLGSALTFWRNAGHGRPAWPWKSPRQHRDDLSMCPAQKGEAMQYAGSGRLVATFCHGATHGALATELTILGGVTCFPSRLTWNVFLCMVSTVEWWKMWWYRCPCGFLVICLLGPKAWLMLHTTQIKHVELGVAHLSIPGRGSLPAPWCWLAPRKHDLDWFSTYFLFILVSHWRVCKILGDKYIYIYIYICISTQPAIVYRLNPHVQWLKATLWLDQVEIKTQFRGHLIWSHLISIETWLHPSCLVVNKTNKMVHV